jgi:hypothetical protein
MKRHLLMLTFMVQHEKKKALSLAVLVLFLLVAVGRAVWSMGPKKAAAFAGPTPVSGGVPAPGTETVDSLASAGEAAVARAIASEGAARGSRRRSVIEVPASPPLDANIFALHPAHFVPPAQTDQVVITALTPGHNAVESKTQNADVDPHQALLQLIAQTATWRLKSVMLPGTSPGAHATSEPFAVVETHEKGAPSRSDVVKIGQDIQGWIVIEIQQASIVVEKESVRVRLSLAPPGTPGTP